MKSCIFRLATLLLVHALALGCTKLESDPQESSISESSSQGDAGLSVGPATAGMSAAAESDAVRLRDAGASGDSNPSNGSGLLEAYEVALSQSVTLGAFVLDLAAARIEPLAATADSGKTVVSPFAKVRIDFKAHNVSTEIETPLAQLDDDGIMLEAAGKFFFGTVDADSVPGLRDGLGSVSWVIEDSAAAQSLREAVVTFGAAAQNKVVIPFGDVSATVTLADVPAQGPFVIAGYGHTTIDVSDVRVQFNSRGGNEPVKSGTALLVVEGLLITEPTAPHLGVSWSEENFLVQRPDGVSVVAGFLAKYVERGKRSEFSIAFEIVQPVSGAYTFGVSRDDLPVVTQQIVVP